MGVRYFRRAVGLDDAPLASGTALVLDLSGITYCDSTGVSVLAYAYRRTEAAGARLALAGAATSIVILIAELFAIDGFDWYADYSGPLSGGVTTSPIR